MKNAVLLLLLLPFFGFSQTTIVRWRGFQSSANATIYNTDATSAAFTTAGINVNNDGWNGIQTSNWSTGASLDENKYMQFTVAPVSGKQITLGNFNYQYQANSDGARKITIKYSFSQDFSNPVTILDGETPAFGNYTDKSVSFNGAVVPNGKTVYVRLYGYQHYNIYYAGADFRFASVNSNGGYNQGYGEGIAITGTIANAPAAVMTANNDSYTVNLNTATPLTVLSNDDSIAGVTSLTTTNPAHGTLIVNPNRTITYTPAANYAGTDSFTYTIANGTNPNSTATVSLTVRAVAPTGMLNGTYLVGTNGHFTTLTSAVTYLNTNGISGPVNFLLTNASYSTNESFPLTINTIASASATNTVTFKPYTGVSPVITATNVNNYTGIPAIFYLNGADYVTFDGSNTANGTTKNLTLDNQDYIDYIQRSVFWVASNGTNGATHITVKNCNIKQSVRNQGGKFSVGVYSGSNGTGDNNTMSVAAAGANNSDLTVTNNDFMSVKQGVYINGGATLTTNVTVTKNDLGATTNAETIICPATFVNVNGFEYNDNLVNNLYRSTDDGNLVSAGIYVTGASKNGSILRNVLKDLTKTTTNNQIFGGIVLASTDFNANILVANNFILNVSADGNGGGYLNGYGIVVDNGGKYKIYNNTVSLNTNQAHGGFSAAFYVNTPARSLDVRNNIFANNQTSTATRRSAIVVNNTVGNISAVFTNLDNNDYYSKDRLGYITNINTAGQIDWAGNGVPGAYEDNADYTYTLQQWQGVTLRDAHSVSVNPVFVSSSDLHINTNAANTGIADGGVALTEVTRDIDNQLRNATPDMGADEFGPSTAMPTAGDATGIYCDGATTWNGTAWSNGNPDATKDVIFNADFTQNGGNFYACSIYVLAGKNVNFTNNSNTIVTHTVNVATTGSLTFESSSNLLQLTDDANTGTVTVKRNGSNLKKLDYTMWSAPVLDKRATGYQTLQSFSPETVATRFYEYSPATSYYMTLPAETTKFTLGKGILIRMPNTDPAPGYNEGTARLIFKGAFTGTPNNGTLSVPVDNSGRGFNAVGNPYPSPISVKAFINENLNVIDGTIWIWRKTNDQTVSSYSTVNLTGYCANVARGGSNNDGNNLIEDPYAIDPNGSLNTAQGFIVKAKSNGSITYKNSMRLQTHSNAFFRTAATQATTERLWINVSNNAGEFSQSLIGYNEDTTLGYDNGYDGKALINGNLNLYTVVETANDTLNLTIQARGAFANTDRVKLGYTAEVAGSFTLSLDHADGRFSEGQEIYIIDNITGITHNITDAAFTFTSEIGTFNDRFTVVYAPDGALGTETPVLQTKEVIVYKSGKQVKIEAPADINTVTVYDMLGKTLFQKSNIDGISFATTDINATAQVVIVQITLDNQQVISKKIIMN